MTDVIDPDLAALQERWSPGWKIWRARRAYDAVPSGSYVASLMDPSVGITPTLMSTTAKALDIALKAQADAAATGATWAPEPPLWP